MSGTSDIGPFSIVPRWVRDACKGKPWAIVLYACLADHADRTRDNGWTIGRQELADEIGCSDRTVDASVGHLEAVGALEVAREIRNGRKVWSRYVIRMVSPTNAKIFRIGGEESSHSPIEPHIKTPSSRDLAFDEFWKGYPRKESKPAARRAWKQIKPDEDLAVMLGLSLWVAYWKRAETTRQYIPEPPTWLNKRKWEDDVPDADSSVGPKAVIVELEDGWRRNTVNGELWDPHRGYWMQDHDWVNPNRRTR